MNKITINNLKSIFNTINQPVIIENSRNEVIYANHSAVVKLGDDLDSVLSLKISEIINNTLSYIEWGSEPLLNDKDELIGNVYTGNKIVNPNNAKKSKVDEIIEYYENIIALMPGHVYWQDRSGVYLGCNDQQAKSAGLSSRKEIVNKTNRDLPWNINYPELVEKLDKINQEVMETGIPITVEEPATLEDSSEAIYLSKKHPLRNEKGEVIGVLGISFDITERKRAEKLLIQAKEQAEIANQAKSDFIACMSHDLRTPLNGIFGAIQILQRSPHHPEQVVFHESINKSANNLLNLVEDILNFAKLESGKIQLRSEAFDMRKLVEDVVTLVAHQANQKGLKLIVSYCDFVPCYLISDPNAIRRILINLVGNAIKFTDSGHILISVDLVKSNKEQALIQLTVEDTGIGIPKEKIGLIFDRFSRITPSYSGKYQGSGLGLTIVKQLSEGLNGTVNVNSQLGCGSTFWCSLPVKLQEQPIVSSNWQKNYSDVRIMVIDDYNVRAKYTIKQIGSKNNIACESTKAISELRKAKNSNNPFQVVIIDDEIINKSAVNLCEQIKAIADFDNLMLVLFSSPKTLSETEMAKKKGFFRQLIKPIQPGELASELASAWGEWQSKVDKISKTEQQKKYNVLLVEDDPIAQTITRTILEKLGCVVTIVDMGIKAVEEAAGDYDFIFMDIGLPDIDGITATKTILKERKGFHTPIIGLTAHVFEYNRLECINSGMSGFITKPVTFTDFEKVLEPSNSDEIKTEKEFA